MGIKRKLYLIRPTTKTLKVSIILNDERLSAFPPRSGLNQGYPFSLYSTCFAENPGHYNMARERNKRQINWNGINKSDPICRYDYQCRKSQRIYPENF